MVQQNPARNSVSTHSYRGATMKLVLAVAVLLITLSAVVTDSNEDGGKEPTMAQKFEKFQKEVQTFVDNLGEKTKAALHEFHNSEFSNKTRNWLSKTFQKLKNKFEPMTSQDGWN